MCSTERTGADQRYDEHMDEAAEEEGLKRYQEARANEMFPDEVDTPLDVAARIRSVLLLCRRGIHTVCKCCGFSSGGKQTLRQFYVQFDRGHIWSHNCPVSRFQRYRGLKSFRSSPWDPMENLPLNYSRIFQFQSFERTRHRILAEAAAEEEGAMVKKKNKKNKK